MTSDTIRSYDQTNLFIDNELHIEKASYSNIAGILFWLSLYSWKARLKSCLNYGHVFVRGRTALPDEKCFGKDAIMENHLVRRVEYLNGGVRCSSRVRKYMVS